ncbi:MAG: helix-turn-helix domain-containing protein [Variovorax sp.]|nr:helix-turn-helix domain-containing protein [Variovorax sp.]
MNAMHRACDLVGGVSKMAAALGVAAPTVRQWVTGLRPVPPRRCPAVEGLTGGLVSRRELRPDDWREIWPELAAANDSTPAPLAAGGAHA